MAKMTKVLGVLSTCAMLSAAVVSATGGRAEKVARQATVAKEIALEQGWIEGIRKIELLRPDLLSVTLDGGITGAINAGNELAVEEQGGPTDHDDPAAFTVVSATDPNYADPTHPARIGRASYPARNCMAHGEMWAARLHPITWHDYFLFLPRPLKSGHSYTIRPAPPKEPDERVTTVVEFAYDAAATPTKAIKINQVGYFALASRRYAYLGWWAGSEGPVDYSSFKTFDVVDEATGETVLTGDIALRAENDAFSGENVYELDISALGPGRYRIRIPGLARSYTFRVGGAGTHELYYHSMRAFFHQRCGQELGAPYTWVEKPACHTAVWKSGNIAEGRINAGDGAPLDDYTPEPGETKKSFKGGYHDAADYDTFAYHLPATAEILDAFEQNPDMFADTDLDLPESGNGIPDLLDEAHWGLSFHLENQYDNGAVPLGRINECDAKGQNIEGGKKAPMPPYGVIPPTRLSTPTFAAVAAKFSRVLRPYNAELADRYLESAKKAFAYASVRTPEDVWREFSNPPDGEPIPLRRPKQLDAAWLPYLTWAAAELLRSTGDEEYRAYIDEHRKVLGYWQEWDLRLWACLKALQGEPGTPFYAQIKQKFQDGPDKKIQRLEQAGYRMSNGQKPVVGWGRAQGIDHAPTLLRAYWLTGEQKYLDAALFNADFHLGCNPLGKCSLTGMGYNPPRRPEISWFLYEKHEPDMGGRTVKGIGIYGIGPPLKSHPGKWPLWRSWRDIWGMFAEIYSEFTVPQTIGPSAMAYSAFYAMEKKAGLIPPDSKPDPLKMGDYFAFEPVADAKTAPEKKADEEKGQ